MKNKTHNLAMRKSSPAFDSYHDLPIDFHRNHKVKLKCFDGFGRKMTFIQIFLLLFLSFNIKGYDQITKDNNKSDKCQNGEFVT